MTPGGCDLSGFKQTQKASLGLGLSADTGKPNGEVPGYEPWDAGLNAEFEAKPSL